MTIEVQGVLLVHEDTSWCRRVARKLAELEVAAHVATSTSGALRVVESNRPEVALVDLATLPTPTASVWCVASSTPLPRPRSGCGATG